MTENLQATVLNGAVSYTDEADPLGIQPVSKGGTGLTDAGNDDTKALMSDGAGGFVMATPASGGGGGSSPTLTPGFSLTQDRSNVSLDVGPGVVGWYANGMGDQGPRAENATGGAVFNGKLSLHGTTLGTTDSDTRINDSDAGDFGNFFGTKLAVCFFFYPVTTSNIRAWMGMFDSDPIASNTPGASGIKGVGFRFSTEAGDTAIHAVASNGVADTIVDTGVAFTAGWHSAVIDGTNPASVKFYIDDILVATITTTLPGSSDFVYIVHALRTLANAAAQYYMGRMAVQNS